MTDTRKDIHPIFSQLLQRSDKEALLQQRAKAIWMTGLSGSGKSAIAKAIEQILHEKGFMLKVLDGDNVRKGLNSNLGFSIEDRMENIRRIAEMSKLFLECGIITINSFISPTIKIREMAKKIIGEEDFAEVYLNCPLAVCEQRDTKGLYKKARAGEIKNFTGISAVFEAPLKPALEIKTDELSIEGSAKKVTEFILPFISYK